MGGAVHCNGIPGVLVPRRRAVAALGEGCAVFNAAYCNQSSSREVDLVSALGVGVNADFRGSGANRIHKTAFDVDVAVCVHAVVAGGICAYAAASYGHVPGAVDAVIGLGKAVNRTAGDVHGALGFNGFMA